jgi:hypothetical protein
MEEMAGYCKARLGRRRQTLVREFNDPAVFDLAQSRRSTRLYEKLGSCGHVAWWSSAPALAASTER